MKKRKEGMRSVRRKEGGRGKRKETGGKSQDEGRKEEGEA